MKNFIICGASRAGKTILARRIAKKYDVSWICGDAHVGTLETVFPSTGVSMHENPLEVAEYLESYFGTLIWNYNYEGGGVVLDTVHLLPHNVMKIRKDMSEISHRTGDVSCVFLGYPDIDAIEKLKMIRQNDPIGNFWTAERSDEELLGHINNHINHAKTTRDDCAKFNIPYFDTGNNYEEALDQAYKSLISQTE